MTHWTRLYCIKMSWWKNFTYLCIYPTKQFIELIMEVECTIQLSFCTIQLSLNSYITLAKQRSKKYWCLISVSLLIFLLTQYSLFPHYLSHIIYWSTVMKLHKVNIHLHIPYTFLEYWCVEFIVVFATSPTMIIIQRCCLVIPFDNSLDNR